MLPLAVMLLAMAGYGDHLRPERVRVAAYDRLAERTLGADVGSRLEMRESPSFSGERTLTIVKRDGYRVVVVKARSSIWYGMVQQMERTVDVGLPRRLESAETTVIPETETCSGPITRRTFEKLRAVWVAAVAGARPADEDELGLDGTSYRFTVHEREGARSGSTWSPPAGTNVAGLVSLGKALIAYACGDSSGRRTPERDLAKAADELFVRFRLAP